jgi:hypothetical protein
MRELATLTAGKVLKVAEENPKDASGSTRPRSSSAPPGAAGPAAKTWRRP